ncbi:MAG: EthD family reductase [Desulfomicrobium sp.]|uniref:EthD family reductase n=1 Tax=Hoeflea sp. TaxID=1940281 RepID=UPI0025BCD057|nr:EthD family reductase [Hoeflea sp.]MBU4527433.1 EthD family reductase [Alphaproteobacteria bacterium]MBV1713061.1 EthD family reductase [Desulfomicrobium sp.]MBU4543150.1 EthD family reductase [Alphaproteobacteria bacterium]MBU4551841.1 EthD family reductase [Alphaproteobacteria bacterium]MBV1785430.1 EthD family reductase [Hoeflea sp.]
MKLVTFLKRRADMTRDAFVERWLTKHAPMAAIFPGLRKYTLSGACGPDGHSDAFAELWFDDREACQAAYSSDVGRSGSGDANSYTSRRAQALLDEEWLTQDLEQGGEKVVLAVKRAKPIARPDFVAWWQSEVGKHVLPLIGMRQARLCFDREGLVLNSNPESNDGLKQAEGEVDGLLEIWTSFGESPESVATQLEPFISSIQRLGIRAELLMLRENRIV